MKNQKGFRRNCSTTSLILTVLWIIEEESWGTTTVCRFLQSIHFYIKIEQILLAYGLTKETVTAIVVLYKNIKAVVCSADEDADFFKIIPGVLQGDTLFAHTLLRLCTSIINWSNKRKWLHIKESKMHVVSYINSWVNLVLLTNTPTQAESLLYSIERAAGGFSLYMNTNEIEYMCFFSQKGVISTLWQVLKISDPVLISWQQHLIDWKWSQHMPSKGSECY